MQDILTTAMSPDGHQDIIVACLLEGSLDVTPEPEIRTLKAHPSMNLLYHKP